jgi:hypothetical protein
MAIASNINQKTLDAFGIERAEVKAAEPIAKPDLANRPSRHPLIRMRHQNRRAQAN